MSPKGAARRAGEGEGSLGLRLPNLAADLPEDERRSDDKTLRDAISVYVRERERGYA